MIVKSLSGGASRIDGIIKYIFRAVEPEQSRDAKWQQLVNQFGITLTEQDIRFLEQESGDRELSRLFEECGYDMQQFMDRILNTHLVGKVNIRGTSLETYAKAFHENYDRRTYKSSNSVGYHHYILSFSPEEKDLVTKEVLQDFAHQFYSLYGHRTVYLASAHMDDNPHIHCLVGSSTFAGRSTSLRQDVFQSLKLKLDAFQREKYPALVHSLPQHGKGKQFAPEKRYPKTKNEDERSSRVALANQCLVTAASSATSTSELFEKVQQEKFSVYYRSGRPQGLIDEVTGIKMRWKNFSIDIPGMLEDEASEKQKLQTLAKHRSTQLNIAVKGNRETEEKLTEEEHMLSELNALRSTTSSLETELEATSSTNSEPDNEVDAQDEHIYERALEEDEDGENEESSLDDDEGQDEP